MDAELRYNLFLALKEALNNIVKHAHATEVRLELRLEDGAFTLALQDDGKGMAVATQQNGLDDHRQNGARDVELQTPPERSDRILGGHGLKNLEKRLRAVGGECAILSRNGSGTRIEMSVRIKSVASPIVAIGIATPGGR
jgi:signal transduction histidine kinase